MTNGLYNPAKEHDSCGIGFVVDIKNRKSHDIIHQGLDILVNLAHRGAVGADPLAGDGAGILLQIPDQLLREECAQLGFELPPPGQYAVGMVFMPRDDASFSACQVALEDYAVAEGQRLLGWRDVPVDGSCLGYSVKPDEPVIRQIFIGRAETCPDIDAFERKLYVIRKRTHRTIRGMDIEGSASFYIGSLSARTVLYKGMVLGNNLSRYYLDLGDARMVSALALVHQRFSTNTFPSWQLAQPFRYICHNGEINTLQGNINWMRARRASMKSDLLGNDLAKLWPLLGDIVSDSATFDNALEFLVAAGYSMAHAMMMLIPEAWLNNPLMDEDRRAFYEYHAALMEPWDGPAAIAFTDGRQIGATLDRNGLRPARYIITDDDRVVMSSETGVSSIPEHKILEKWRLQPGKMLLIDLEQGRIIDDAELKVELAGAKPYQKWLDETQINVDQLPAEVYAMPPDRQTLLNRQRAFGYTEEDIKYYLKPMAVSGMDPIGAMGRDTPPAALSDQPKMMYDYFKQKFAQVTNPPIDPIREELVMSLVSYIGPRPNLLDLNTGGSHMRLEVHQPILTDMDLERIRRVEDNSGDAFRTRRVSICYPAEEGVRGMEAALARVCDEAEQAVRGLYNILILTDRGMDADRIAIPALLATSAVHHHLLRTGLRTEMGLVIETGEARKVHDFCCLAGYGAEAINPYLAFDTLSKMLQEPGNDLGAGATEADLHKSYVKAVNKGILKVMSKMGISTYQSYCGAQIFDAVGLASRFVERYFTGTDSVVEGIGLSNVAEETVRRHGAAYGRRKDRGRGLDDGGEIAYRRRGEVHQWTPDTMSALHRAVRSADYGKFKHFSAQVDDQSRHLKNLRGLFEFRSTEEPVSLEEVEPVDSIVKRFATGAMSFGSISWEAHTTLAIAMNRIGGKSNTGEGGEVADRYTPSADGSSMRSAIKQVASGRFGVSAEYLVNADDIQIKMAQGAKPGEGGQLPGHKVNEWIAQVRHSTPGVGLISPPPHHDIYSIEDLAQLIHDLKNVNPQARISVKLVSEVGVGTVAAGVAKAHADHVTISGDDGGTGASPLTSIYHAGSPWELGLSETHQTLVNNNLRGRIAVQVDGGLRTGRDVVVGALLGADEFGFATAALMSMGCLMMRKCHLNTCPVGIATQDPDLRKRFSGEADHVVNYMRFVAEEVREIMAGLGFRTMQEMIGKSAMLDTKRAIAHHKARGLDFNRVLYQPEVSADVAIYNCQVQEHGLDNALDHELISRAQVALDNGEAVVIDDVEVRNVNRTLGAMLSGEVARRYGHQGLADDTIRIFATGTGGQSFGAFLARGISIDLTGDANDYAGKGLSGGRLVMRPAEEFQGASDENIIVGNTVLYGAISGECYFRGVAGERFAVRNSGATAVVEGLGDHGCEYMTGGVVVVLGRTGRNFAAGMSGGVAYVLDERGDFPVRTNRAMVELEPVVAEADALGTLVHHRHDPEPPDRDAIMKDMIRHDALRLRTLIEQHLRYTGSSRARQILEDWENYLPRFVKVMPVEYRAALEQLLPVAEQDDIDDGMLDVGT